MNLPFGLDLKSVAVGMLLAYFAVPWILGLVNRSRNTSAVA
jgi:hypothetical protein